MCDTQVIRHAGMTFFAKNSDREAAEPQYVNYFPAASGDASDFVQTTYIPVRQVPERHAVILSQPSWIWGAEMGVNEHGLVIGNEAVFTRVTDRSREALLGMDILRLALERCRTAEAAIDCIDQLLQDYGQGGAAGYRDKSFRYDNSFIIADRDQAWVLETASRHWAARRVQRCDAISNALTITTDFDRHSDGLYEFAMAHAGMKRGRSFNFARTFDTRFMKFMGRADRRRACSLESLSAMREPGLKQMADSLRRHASTGDNFARHGNADVCMHAGGLTRPSQTTGSMLVALHPDTQPEIYVTGTSAPCLSLFQPVSLQAGSAGIAAGRVENEPGLWDRFEPVHRRALLDIEYRRDLLASRNALEPLMFDRDIAVEERAARADQWHREWAERAAGAEPAYRWFSSYDRFWRENHPARTLAPAVEGGIHRQL